MFKKAEIVNVQLEDAVPETSFLHSKYWTKYGGNYSLQLTAHNFLDAYSNTHDSILKQINLQGDF